MEEIVFDKRKAVAIMNFTKDFIANMKMEGSEDDIEDLVVRKLEAEFFERSVGEKVISYYFERPSFLDWLLRRCRTFKVKVEVKDLLINPPATPNTKRIYEIKKI